jgi:uncharacterized protein YgiM (DUF1202 family)
MLRLTFLLCAAMFLTLLVGGRDYGQLRPGLAAAQNAALEEQERSTALALADVAPQPVADLVVAAFVPETDETVVQPPLAMPLVNPNALAEAVAVAVAETPVEPAAELVSPEVWYVTGTTVNVRSGPGKQFDVLEKLVQGDTATLVFSDDTGWAKIRIEGDGVEGFVSTDFLSQTAP